MTLTWPNLGVEPRGWKTPHPRHFSLSLSAFYRNKFVLKINIKWHHRRDQLLLIFVCFWVKQADIQLQVWHNNLYSFHAYINLNDFWNSKQDICKFLSCLLVAKNSNQYSINKAWIIKNYWVNWRFFLQASTFSLFTYDLIFRWILWEKNISIPLKGRVAEKEGEAENERDPPCTSLFYDVCNTQDWVRSKPGASAKSSIQVQGKEVWGLSQTSWHSQAL